MAVVALVKVETAMAEVAMAEGGEVAAAVEAEWHCRSR